LDCVRSKSCARNRRVSQILPEPGSPLDYQSEPCFFTERKTSQPGYLNRFLNSAASLTGQKFARMMKRLGFQHRLSVTADPRRLQESQI
jgi:hypothetical protein